MKDFHLHSISFLFSSSVLAFIYIHLFPDHSSHVNGFVLMQTKLIPRRKVVHANRNFEDWISDAPDETFRKKLTIEGSIPPYLKGFLIRNGGAKWRNNDQTYTHIFDGLAKISMYDIQQHINNKATVHFQTKFVKSKWYHKVNQSKGIPASISVGPVINQFTKQKQSGAWQSIMAIIHILQFDNPCVNIWNFNTKPNTKNPLDQVTAITDAPPRAQISVKDLATISSSTNAPPTSQLQGYELFCTTHPEYSKIENGVTYNMGVELGLHGPKVILTQEANSLRSREVIARSDTIHGIPYNHSFGVNGKYATIVLQPLRANLNIAHILKEGYFSVMDHLDYTQIIVFDLETGKVALDRKIDEKIYFYHTISAAEEHSSHGLKVSIRLCAYKTPDIITGKHQFMKLDKCTGINGKKNRDCISQGGTICDIVCNLDDSSVDVQWKDKITQGFELPTTRYSRSWGKHALREKHPRYIYAYCAFANGSDDYDNWALYKFDTEEDCINSYYQRDSLYVSEPIFVPDPNGTTEDDGVILSQVYDGNRRETALLILNAKNMTVLATAWTGQRSPMDFHGTFISTR